MRTTQRTVRRVRARWCCLRVTTRGSRFAASFFFFFVVLGACETLHSMAADADGADDSGPRPRSRYDFEGLEAPDLIAVASAIDTAFAPESLARLHASFWRLWQEELPATYLVNNVQVAVAHRRIRGLSSPYRIYATTHMHELWVED